MSNGNYVVQNNKCFNPLANAVSGLLAAFTADIDPTTTLNEVFDILNDGVTMYTVVANTSGNVYPVAVSTNYGHKAIVIAIKANGTASFIFIYDGEMYICDAYTSPSGVTVDSWYQITTTAVNTANE